MEQEFARVFAPRLSVENGVAPPEELIAISPLLVEFEKRGLDLSTFPEVWDDVVEPRRMELLAELRKVFDRDAAFHGWAFSWDLALLETASGLVGESGMRRPEYVRDAVRTVVGWRGTGREVPAARADGAGPRGGRVMLLSCRASSRSRPSSKPPGTSRRGSRSSWGG